MSNRTTFLKIILGIIALEFVRNRYNNLEKLAHQKEWNRSFLLKRQKILLLVSSLVYGIFVSFGILNFLISLTQKITSVYPNTAFLKRNIALLIMLALSYIVSVAIARIVLQLYIREINRFPNFCRKFGLKVWDGAKIIGQTPHKATKAVVKGTKKGFKVFGKVGKKTASLAVKGSKQVADKATKGAKVAGKVGFFGVGLGIGLTSMGIGGVRRLLSKVFKKKNRKSLTE